MTDDFLKNTEKSVMQVLKQLRPTLVEAFGTVGFETKYDQTVVTQLDRHVEERLRELLKTIDAGIGIEGEEYGVEGNRETYWTIDPIDGTEQFIRGIPVCQTLLCLVENHRPVWTLMYRFVSDELYLARDGQGVTCNGKAVKMAYRPLGRAWIEISTDLRKPESIEVLQRVRPHIAGYAITRDMDQLMTGKVDGMIALNTGGGPWDYAPRQLLYTEAGGRIANIGSDRYDFTNNTFVMAHERNFEELMGLVTPSWS